MMKVISLRNDAEAVFHPLSKRNMSQYSKCMSETVGTTKSYIHYIFLIHLSLWLDLIYIRSSKTLINNNKIKQL